MGADKFKDDLEKVLGKVETVEVRGITISVREVDMLGLKDFARSCSPFLGAFNDPERLGVKVVDGKPTTPEGFRFFTLVAEHSPAFIDTAVLVTDAPRNWLEKLPADDFIIIADKIVEVNARFFSQRLAPALVRLGQSLAKNLGTGLSRLLSERGTDLATLAGTPTANFSGSQPLLPPEA